MAGEWSKRGFCIAFLAENGKHEPKGDDRASQQEAWDGFYNTMVAHSGSGEHKATGGYKLTETGLAIRCGAINRSLEADGAETLSYPSRPKKEQKKPESVPDIFRELGHIK